MKFKYTYVNMNFELDLRFMHASRGCTLFCNEVGEKRGKLRAVILEDFVMFSENRAHKSFISATV